MRRLWLVLFIIASVFGASYAALIVNAMIGPWSAVAIEQDGSATHMQFGQDLPRPEWVPVDQGSRPLAFCDSAACRWCSATTNLFRA